MIQIVPTPYSLPAAEDLQRDAPFHPRTTWGDMPWAMPLTWMTPQEIIGQASETKKKIQEALEAGISVIDCTKEPAVERRKVGVAFTVSGRFENGEPREVPLPLGCFETLWVQAKREYEQSGGTMTGLRTTFKPIYPGFWPWIKRRFGIYTP